MFVCDKHQRTPQQHAHAGRTCTRRGDSVRFGIGRSLVAARRSRNYAASKRLMTVFGCHHCSSVHGRSTSLSSRGCMYFDSDIPTNFGGLYGCPQCTYLICALCADELSSVCVCGGELVHGIAFKYDPVELPKQIRQLPTTGQRTAALETLRSTTHMIVAEYESHLFTINAAEDSRTAGEALPPNGGSLLVRKLSRIYAKHVITARELAWRIWDYVVEENVDELLSHADECVTRELRKLCDGYPTSPEEWDAFLVHCEPHDYHVPQRDPRIRRDYIRDRVTTLRDAIARDTRPG